MLTLNNFPSKNRKIFFFFILTKKIKIQFCDFLFIFYGVQLFSVIFLSWCGAGLLSSPLEDEDRWSKFFELDSTIWWWLLWSPRVFIKTLRAALHWLKAPQNILNICFSCSRASCRHCSKEKKLNFLHHFFFLFYSCNFVNFSQDLSNSEFSFFIPNLFLFFFHFNIGFEKVK